MKTTVMRNRSERLNASRNKQAGDEVTEKQKSYCFRLSLAISGWSKKDYSSKLLGARKLEGSKQWCVKKTPVRKKKSPFF